jgi:hypothetical protein
MVAGLLSTVFIGAQPVWLTYQEKLAAVHLLLSWIECYALYGDWSATARTSCALVLGAGAGVLGAGAAL